MKTNEPVAWMLETERGNISCYVKPSDEFNWIPLYTHPAKTLDRELLDKTITDQQNEIKELRKNLDVALMIVNEPAKTLTDEEIVEIFQRLFNVNKSWETLVFEFARAILRKAQEK